MKRNRRKTFNTEIGLKSFAFVTVTNRRKTFNTETGANNYSHK